MLKSHHRGLSNSQQQLMFAWVGCWEVCSLALRLLEELSVAVASYELVNDEIKKSWGKSNLPQVDLAQVIDEVLHIEVLETVINCFYQLLTKV